MDADKLEDLWFKGPEWLSNPSEWPESIALKPLKQANEEAKVIKEVMMKTVEKPDGDTLWKLTEKYPYWKAMRVTAWVICFIIYSFQESDTLDPYQR